MSRRTGYIGAVGLVLALVFLSVKLVSPRHDAEPGEGSTKPFGPFAGYTWIGPIKSVGASFNVPRIAPGSKTGDAGTWVGVRGQGPPDRFIQVGVAEAKFNLAGKNAVSYFAFWSDVAHHFNAQPPFHVHARDELSAHLTLAHKQWTVTIRDTRSGAHARFAVNNEADGPFNGAQWVQEDPGGTHPAPYPELAAPRFRDLTVNSTPPAAAALYSIWMSIDGRNLAPSPLRNDSFTLAPAPALSAAGAQYLRKAGHVQAVEAQFEAERSHWTPKTPYPQIAAAVSRLTSTIRTSAESARSIQWPPHTQKLVRAAMRATEDVVERLTPPSVLTPASFAVWNTTLTGAQQRAARYGRNLRLALGLPGAGTATPPEHP